jgi:glycosyltransferase involved in cell wall biosynthesis
MSSVDVVVPCYNYGRYLERCVRSLLDQPAVDVRVLIIDDCSSDDTPNVGQRLSAADRRVTYQRHHVNRGHIATYNEGLLGWATADYCLLISADDLVTPGALLRAALVLDSYPRVGLCYGAQQIFSDDVPTVVEGPRDPKVQLWSGHDFWERCCRTGQNAVATPTAVVRTSIQHAVGGYRKELPHSADLDIWLRIAARSDVAYIDTPQAFKRMHGMNMQERFRELEDLKQRQRAFECACADARSLVPEMSRFTRLVQRSLAFEAFWKASADFDRGRPADCSEWLTTATGLDPSIVQTTEWRRLAMKQRLGVTLWGVLQPWVNRLRV